MTAEPNMTTRDKLNEALATLSGIGPGTPRVGLVLGSGLGAFADTLSDLEKIPYGSIPHMPQSTVAGHAGNLCLGRHEQVSVACLQGRVHAYEGHPQSDVVFAVRLLAELGCQAVLLTNAAGGIADGMTPGDLMLITDHLNLTGSNPLVGPNEDEFGPRFPDLSVAYDLKIRQAAVDAAGDAGVSLREGVYAANLGPCYETPAEVRMARTLGASAVGMSTVPEVIALRHRGIRVGAMSCITNLAAGLGDGTLNHAEVAEVAARSRKQFVTLLGSWIRRTSELLDA